MRQVQAELGPEARLQRLREIPARGIARLWRRPTIEIEAHGFEAPRAAQAGSVGSPVSPGDEDEQGRMAASDAGRSVAGVLEELGMDPLVVQRLLMEALGPEADPSVPVRDHLRRVVKLMMRGWREPVDLSTDPATGRRLPVVLLGGPGVGKSTALAKWMAREMASRRNTGPLWILEDGDRPNGSDVLATHAHLLGTPVETRWIPGLDTPSREGGWIDLPGVVPGDEADQIRLRERLDAFGLTRRWLVVHAGYELSLIRRQVRFFAPLGCRGIIVTHLDEDNRAARIWNLAMSEGPAVGYGSWGPRFSDRWEPLDPSTLAAALLEGSNSSSALRP
jgi:flagellar biosynthesis protein FlhF